MFEVIILATAFVFLSVASFLDFRTKEIPDWINYASIATGIGIRLLFAVFSWDVYPLIAGLIGLAVAYVIGCLMFYSGLWGGGDSKLLIGLGALLGISPELGLFHSDFTAFFVDMIFVGAVYSFVYCIVLSLKNKGSFVAEAKKLLSHKYYYFVNKIVFVVGALLFLSSWFFYNDAVLFFLLLAFAIFVIFFFYIFIFIKSVELCCMLRRVDPKELTEGDWVAEDVSFAGKKVCRVSDLGLSKYQLEQLRKLYSQKKIHKVLLKTGIPFTPGWWFALLFMLWEGSLLMFFV